MCYYGQTQQNNPRLSKENVPHHFRSALFSLKLSLFWPRPEPDRQRAIARESQMIAHTQTYTPSLLYTSDITLEVDTCLFVPSHSVRHYLKCLFVLFVWTSLAVYLLFFFVPECVFLCPEIPNDFPDRVASAPQTSPLARRHMLMHFWMCVRVFVCGEC